MSVSTRIVHPGIKLRSPRVEVDLDVDVNDAADNAADHADLDEALRSLVLPGIFPRSVVIQGFIEWPVSPFPFDKLPADIQERIFRLWLFHKGKHVHAFSRLDKWRQPASAPPANEHRKKSHFPPRFYIGNTGDMVSISDDTLKPNEVLAVLLVCRRWYFLGVHCFYGLNVFAFSSLGEFGRFMAGIVSRADRIQHVECVATTASLIAVQN